MPMPTTGAAPSRLPRKSRATPPMAGTASRRLARLAGQLLSVGFEGKAPPAELCARITASEVGGGMLFGPNIADPPQVASLVAALRDASPRQARLLVSIDQE